MPPCATAVLPMVASWMICPGATSPEAPGAKTRLRLLASATNNLPSAETPILLLSWPGAPMPVSGPAITRVGAMLPLARGGKTLTFCWLAVSE